MKKVIKRLRNKLWHRVRFVGMSNVMWWILQSPKLLCMLIYCKIKHQSFKTYYNAQKMVNEVRKTTNYFSEKDNQKRTTLKTYYKQKTSALSVRLRFEKKVTLNDYEAFKDVLAIHTTRATELETKKGWAYFSIIKDFEPIYDFDSTNVSVTVGTTTDGLKYWDWTKTPHMLAVGETGQGKSVFVRYVLKGLLQDGTKEVWCVDGKRIDYASSSHVFKYYVENKASNNEEIIKLVEKFQRYMNLRLEEMKGLDITEYQESDDLKPKFLLLDEYLIIAQQMDKKVERKRLEVAIQDITMRGRAAGYYLILTMQRGDAVFLPANIRDNFRFKIVLGKATDSSYRMMFEDVVQGFDVGYAWYSTGLNLDVLAVPYYKSIDVPVKTDGESEDIANN